jgi:hypothetical protein
MEISGSSLRYATGVALRTPVDLQQLFRACGAMPLGAMLVPIVQDGQIVQLSAKRREGGLTDELLLPHASQRASRATQRSHSPHVPSQTC